VSDYFSIDHLSSDLRGRALKGATVTVIAQGCTFIIQTVGTILLARLLTPDDFGLVAMVLTFSLLLGNFGVNGFTEAIIQARTIVHRQISTLFWVNMCFSVALALLLIACAPLLVWFYKKPDLTPIIITIAASNAMAGLATLHLALLKRGMKFNRISANDVITAIITCIIPIYLAWLGWGYWALVAKWMLTPMVTTAGAWILCGWRPGPPSRNSDIGPMLKFAFNTYGNFVMNYFRRNLDKMLLGRVYGSQQLGSYDRAYQLSTMLPSQVFGSLNSVAIASFSRLAHDPERYRFNFLTVLSVLALVGMPLSAALTLNSSDLIFLLLGPKWTTSAKIFCAFGPSIGVSMLYLTHGWLHLSLGTPERWFRWGILECMVTITALLIGLSFGPVGVAIAYSTSFYFLTGPALWYAGRPIGLSIYFVWQTVWKFMVSAVLAGIVSWMMLYKTDAVYRNFEQCHAISRIILSCSLLVVVYLLLIIALHRGISPLTQAFGILREMFLSEDKKKERSK